MDSMRDELSDGRRLRIFTRVDEFTSKRLDQWAYWNRVEPDLIRSSSPTDNAYIESCNGKLRAECWNENGSLSLEDAQATLDAWRSDCNRIRLHSALGNLAPNEYAETCQSSRTA